jgi:DNA polymerase II large subunit
LVRGFVSHFVLCVVCNEYFADSRCLIKEHACKIINVVITVIKYDGVVVVWVVADTGGF